MEFTNICLLEPHCTNFEKKKLGSPLGASSKVVRILKEGYILPFWNQPTLIRSPIIISVYLHPLRHRGGGITCTYAEPSNRKGKKQASLAFINSLSLVPKPNNKWRPILDQNGDTRKHKDFLADR